MSSAAIAFEPEGNFRPNQPFALHKLRTEMTLGNGWQRYVKREIEDLTVDHGDLDRVGADAPPSAATVTAAAALTDDLPLGIPRPDVCATPKGEVDLTWFVPGGTVSLSVGPDGNDVVLTAMLDDGREYSGCEPWSGRIPETMKCCLRALCVE